MADGITTQDLGYLSGDSTWHNKPQYILVGDRPVSIEEGAKVVDFEPEKVACFVEGPDGNYVPSGGYAIVRKDGPANKPVTILAPSVGSRYVATPHCHLYNSIVENLLAAFPDLRICGTGTLSAGATWWMQMVVENYYVRGDESPNEQRLMYTHTYGQTAHQILVTTVRTVCDNTRRMALDEAAANKLLRKHRHTASAVTKINADLEAMAELKLGAQRDRETMEDLAALQVDGAYVEKFLDTFFPAEESEETSTRAKNLANSARDKVVEIFETGQFMAPSIRRSRYALLNAFTDFVDHHSYSRSDAARWMDAITGGRAELKGKAEDYLADEMTAVSH